MEIAVTTPDYNKVHDKFKLNGYQLDRADLLRNAYSFIKEGAEHEQAVGDFLLDWFDNKSYIEMNTSGTTGKPKVIKVEKHAMVSSALATGDFFGLKPGDKALHCLPTKYIAGKMMFVRGFILGLDVDFVAPDKHPIKNNDTQYDFAAMVPLQARHSLSMLHNVKKLIIGGSKIDKGLEDELLKLPTQVYETYGMTETITHIAAKLAGETAFTVLPNVTISYDDHECLVIHAPRISDDVIVTNDRVKLINENQFIFLGRADNIINSGGIKHLPEQIEDKIADKLPRRFFIAGFPDEELGQKLVLIVEGSEMYVDNSVFSDLTKYEKPKEIIFVPKFAETGSGKVIRKEIVRGLL